MHTKLGIKATTKLLNIPELLEIIRNGKPDQATINWILTHLMKEQSGTL
jgi:hypothetical protein